MKKIAGYVSELIKTILFIGFSIQIILGIIWMCFNFSHAQLFSVSGGPLYIPVEKVGKAVYSLLYLLQLAVAALADYYFVRLWWGNRRLLNIWGALCLLTSPLVLQCHLAVSPFSLVCSLLLLELTFSIHYIRRSEWELSALCSACGCWLMLSLLRPEYLLLGALPILFAVVFKVFARQKSKKKLLRGALVLVAFWGIVWGTLSLSGQESVYSRKNIAFCTFSRAVWPTLWQDSLVLWQPEEVPGLTVEILQQAAEQVEDLRIVVKPMIEEALTEEEAIDFYYLKASGCWILRKKSLLLRCIKDFAGYLLPPVFLSVQLDGRGGETYSGRNYEMMISAHPKWTKEYVSYGCWWFTTALVLTCILAVNLLMMGRMREIPFVPLGLFVILGCVLALAYTFRGAGMLDYKCTAVVMVLWQSLPLATMGKEV